VYCSVLQCVAVCWSVLQCVAVCALVRCSLVHGKRLLYTHEWVIPHTCAVCCNVLQCVAVCCVVCCSLIRGKMNYLPPRMSLPTHMCGVLQCAAVRCSVLRSVLQCDASKKWLIYPHEWVIPHTCAVCCSVLQCVAVCCVVCCSLMRKKMTYLNPRMSHPTHMCGVLHCAAVCCSVLRSVLQCDACLNESFTPTNKSSYTYVLFM